MWNQKGECVKTLQGHANHTYSLTVHNELLCSGSNDMTIRMWNKKGECVRILKGHKGIVGCLAVCNGLLCSSGALDKTIRIWNQKGGCVGVLRGHMAQIRCLTVYNDLLCSGSTDATIRMWNYKWTRYSVRKMRPEDRSKIIYVMWIMKSWGFGKDLAFKVALSF
jgi:WD40 repeat protein